MTVGDQEYGLDLTRTGRVGSGAIMTRNIYNGEYRECSNGLIDIDKTVERLRKAEGLLDAVKE